MARAAPRSPAGGDDRLTARRLESGASHYDHSMPSTDRESGRIRVFLSHSTSGDGALCAQLAHALSRHDIDV